jgi:hypothetical protein
VDDTAAPGEAEVAVVDDTAAPGEAEVAAVDEATGTAESGAHGGTAEPGGATGNGDVAAVPVGDTATSEQEPPPEEKPSEPEVEPEGAAAPDDAAGKSLDDLFDSSF